MKTTLSLLLAVLVLCPALASADEDDYMLGYAMATLNERLPGQDVVAQAVPETDTIVLSASECLSAEQRAEVEAGLLNAPKIRQVRWELPCLSATATAQRTSADEDEETQVTWFPTHYAFEPLLADPREMFTLIRLQNQTIDDDTIPTVAIALAGTAGLASGRSINSEWQLGMQAGVFGLFNVDTGSELVNADYVLGFPLSYRRGPWSFRVRVYHQSSHLGDEFMVHNGNVDRINLSYEVIEGLAAYSWDRFRIYGGGGYVFASRTELDPGQLRYGAEYRRPNAWGDADFIAAVDVKHNEKQHWDPNQSYRVGLTIDYGTREAGLFLAHYNGHSPDGQFYEEEIEYTGIEGTFRF